ncbi:MAG: hypothetical protein JST04_10555 [Bdellovibrionales bacterium]|nr:hypothetical protein [Bdellovibrionales bacterium]
MPKLRQPEITSLFLGLALALGSMGSKCSGVPEKPENVACTSKVAEIIIWDGRIQKVCGCGGVDGEFAAANTALNCTFSLTDEKTVFVYYQGPFLQHQFVPVGTPALPIGPVFDPDANQPIRSHAFTPTATGTYQFQDEYDHTIFGSITVTP